VSKDTRKSISEVKDDLHRTDDSIDQIISLVMDHFKFGYGGYNGWLTNYPELKEEIEKEIEHLRKMRGSKK
jgi:hypothetical protein